MKKDNKKEEEEEKKIIIKDRAEFFLLTPWGLEKRRSCHILLQIRPVKEGVILDRL
jgi:hypothetical protein